MINIKCGYSRVDEPRFRQVRAVLRKLGFRQINIEVTKHSDKEHLDMFMEIMTDSPEREIHFKEEVNVESNDRA